MVICRGCCCLVTKSYPTRLVCPSDFPGRNAGAGCHFPPRDIFPTAGLSLALLHCQVEGILTTEPSRGACISLVHMCVLSHFGRVQLCATLWTVACQAPQPMGFSEQEYWSGLPCPPPRDLPNSEIEPASLKFPALAGGLPVVPPGTKCIH